MPDQIEELFADLRAETLPTVRPPGTEPLRRAVRRRAITSVATAVTVLGLAALIAVVRPGDRSEPVVSTPSAAPTYSDATLTDRITAALKLDDSQHAGLSGIILDTGSGMPESRRPVLGGTYDIRMTCYGSGSMDVTVSDAVVRTVPCDPTGTVWTVSVVIPEPSGQLTVRAVPQGGGPSQAGFGYVANLRQADESRWQEAVGEALGPKTDGFAGGGSLFASEGSTGYDNGTVEPGRYRVRAVCLGFGTVRLSIATGSDLPPVDQATVHCSPDAPRTASVTMSASGKGLYYQVDPDTDTDYRAAVATVLERY